MATPFDLTKILDAASTVERSAMSDEAKLVVIRSLLSALPPPQMCDGFINAYEQVKTYLLSLCETGKTVNTNDGNTEQLGNPTGEGGRSEDQDKVEVKAEPEQVRETRPEKGKRVRKT